MLRPDASGVGPSATWRHRHKNNSSLLTSFTKRNSGSRKRFATKLPDMRWLNKWDLSSILMENVDLANSQSAFNLPMVDVSVSPSLHISLTLSYTSGDYATSGSLGNGWNLHNTMEYIVLNHQQSMFPENFVYQLFVEGQQSQLKPDPKEDGRFILEGHDDVEVTYDKAEQRWTVITPYLVSVYGKPLSPVTSSAYQWTLSWPNWRGPGQDENELVQEIIGWYLVSKEEKHGARRKLHYGYKTEERQVSNGQKFTSVLLLDTIVDSTGDISMKLSYNEKQNIEYVEKNIRGVDGTISFPIPYTSKYFLTSFLLTTNSFRQQIDFQYTQANKCRTLISIAQTFDSISSKETIMQFIYKEVEPSKPLLQEIILPAYQSSVKFDYKQLEIPVLKFEKDSLNTLRYPATENIQISQGTDFAVTAFDIGTGGVYVRVFNKQLTRYERDLYTCPDGNFRRYSDLSSFDSNREIVRFATVLFSDLIAVIEETEDDKKVNIFHRRNETLAWPECPNKSILMPKDAIFRYSDKIMAIAWNYKNQTNHFTIIEPIPNTEFDGANDDGYISTDVSLGNRMASRFVVNGQRVFLYDGAKLVGFKNLDDQDWREYNILNKESQEQSFLDQMTIEEDMADSIVEQIPFNGLHVVDNMILLSTVNWNKPYLSTQINMLLVDENFTMKRWDVENVKMENIEEITKEQVLDDESVLVFHYKMHEDSSKYKAYLKDIRGPLFEDGCKDYPDNKKEECKKELIKLIQEQQGSEFESMPIFDPEPFMKFQLEQSRATTSTREYKMTGNTWKWQELTNSSNIRLTAGYVLETNENRTSGDTLYSLYRQNPSTGGRSGGLVDQFVIGNEGTMAIGYPSYLAKQPDIRQRPQLILFPEDASTKMAPIELGDRGEQILRTSNHEILVTIRNSTDPALFPFDKELIIRRVNSVVPTAPMWTLSQMQAQHQNVSRIRKYINTFGLNEQNIAQENKIQVIAVGSESSNGLYEECTIVPIEAPQNSTKSQNWYDSEGQLVHTKSVDQSVEDQEDNSEESEEIRKAFKVFDASGQMEVLNTSPHNITENMVAYFGFEKYELNTFKFHYNVTKIVENEFSLTGDRLLRLMDPDTVSVTLEPTQQKATLLASTWVRSNGGSIHFLYDSPVEFFKAQIRTLSGIDVLGIYGQMKKQFENWTYIEIAIDLERIRSSIYSEMYRKTKPNQNLTPPLHTNFTVNVAIDSGSFEFLDIDHVRVAPAHLGFPVSVYNSQTGMETETITANGGITRRFYDFSGIEVGSTDENGNLEQLQIVSRSGATFPVPTATSPPEIQILRQELVIYPEQGHFETFDKYLISQKWEISGPDSAWSFSKGILSHNSEEQHVVSLKNPESFFDPTSSAVRFVLSRLSSDAKLAISLYGYELILQINAENTLTIGNDCRKVANMPSTGEMLLYVEGSSIFVWFDGVLIADRNLNRGCLSAGSLINDKPWTKFDIVVSGALQISDLMLLSQPEVTLEYQNSWGDRTQVIQLENSQTAIVSETVYDELGRDAVKVKSTRILRAADHESIFKFHDSFVSNRDPHLPNSVFKTGIVEGLASTLNPLDDGYPYNRNIYHNDMLREVKVEGLAGKVFSVDGTFTKQHGRESEILFLKLLFPPQNGFKQKVTYEPNGNINVVVVDKKEQDVAEYVKVVGYENILSINEYDENGNLLKVVPPSYHKQMNTFMTRTTPWNFGDENLTPEEKMWQDRLATHFRYDEQDQLIWKKTPDLGTKGFKYDPMGNVRFMYNLKSSNASENKLDDVAEDVIYLLNIGRNKPVEVGYISEPISVAELESYMNSTIPIPGSSVHQTIAYSSSHADPELRNKLRLFLTYNDNKYDSTSSGPQPPHQELLKFNEADQVVMKTSDAVFSQDFTKYMKHYKGGKLREVQLPGLENGGSRDTGFTLMHFYDKLGRTTNLGTRSNPSQFVNFTYNAAGQVESEIVEPGTSYQVDREYVYDSPGLLRQIRESFLTQSNSFIDDGYGQMGFGDGIITQSTFNSTWSNLQNLDSQQREWFRIPVDDYATDKMMTMCLTALQRLGFVDQESLIPLKFLTQQLLSELPQPCGGSLGHTLQKLVAQYMPPASFYGHKYAYGSQRELTKAKFFASDDSISRQDPFKVQSLLSEIEELEDVGDAQAVFDILANNSIILIDNGNPDDKLAAIGKQGTKSIFRYMELSQDLAEIDAILTAYTQYIMQVLYSQADNETHEPITLEEFQDKFVEWNGYLDMSTPIIVINRAKAKASEIFTMLQSKDYLDGGLTRLLDQSFVNAMEPYSLILPKLTKVLTTHFKSQIGTNIYDFESYSIDSNGNHVMFYAGYHRHQLEYKENTNQIAKLIIQDPYDLPGENESVYEIQHDSQGNVCKAPHRGVERIVYHPVINRPILMELSDGRKITIKYDAQGERVLKRVFKDNKLISEVKYLRDEHGAVLMDKRVTFDDQGNKLQDLTSTYLYGPRKTILGFIRNGKFYNVFTDHAGSPRIITHKGKVVAGYDYWPYGELIKAFGEEDAQLMYRFTGQEYDPETGLYNYHARIYDPTIGRFFQPDPKSQYFSPYVYGGNSPVSLVDPDGEFFFLLFCVIGAVVGAYLAGAAANGNWNPAKWKWKSAKTWLAIISGGIGGAMLPGGFMALASQIGVMPAILVGLGGAYMQGAVQNGNWNPGEWDWTKPSTFNAFLEGFSSAVGMANNVVGLKEFADTFSKTGQKVFVYVGAVAGGTGMALWKGKKATGTFKFWDWDLSDPSLASSLLDGFSTGIGLPEQGFKMYKQFGKLKDKKIFHMKVEKPKSTDKKLFKDILKDNKHMLFESLGKALLAYAMGAIANEKFDFWNWDLKSKSTYEGLLNGWKMGNEIKGMYEQYQDGKLKAKFIGKYKGAEANQVYHFDDISMDSANRIEQIADFYYEDYAFAYRRRKQNADLIQIALDIIDEFAKPESSLKIFDDTEFGKEMRQMLAGLVSGFSVIPTAESGLEELVDCVTATESIHGFPDYASCNIANMNGKKWLQNRELVHKLFIPTNLYQSKSAFIKVPVQDQPEEFVDTLQKFLRSSLDPQWLSQNFLSSMVIGSLYNSLVSSNSTTNMFVPTELPTTNLPVVHTATISQSSGKKTLAVRSVLSLEETEFNSLKADLTSELLNLRFECYLPEDLSEGVEKIQGEILAVVKANNEIETHIITPDYSPKSEPCPNIPRKLIQIPNPEISLTESFDLIQARNPENAADLAQYFETFLTSMITEFSNMRSQSGFIDASFQGFVTGFLAGNTKLTYNLSLKTFFTADSVAISMIPKRRGKGQETSNGVPMLIHFLEQNPANERRFLFHAAVQSTRKSGLIGFINANQNVQVRYEELPSYDGVLAYLLSRNAPKIESLIQYLYYSNGLTSPPILTTNTENAHFISNFFLGEFFSKVGDASVEAYTYIPNGNSGERLNAQRIFFVRDANDTKAAIFNIIEGSILSGDNFHFDDSVSTDVPSMPDVDITQLILCELKLNINSVSGWDLDEMPNGTAESQAFFQGLTCQSVSPTRIPKDTTAYLKLESPNPPPRFNFEKDFVKQMFENLKENRLQKLVNTNLDFQSVVKGLLVGTANQVQPDVDGIKLALRQIFTDSNSVFPDITPLSLVSVAENGQPLPQTEQVLLSSLHAIDTDKEEEGNQKLEEAKEDIKSYYCENKERISQVLKLTKLPAVYNSVENDLPENMDRVKFETDPDSLSNITCDSAENPFKSFAYQYNGNPKTETKPEPKQQQNHGSTKLDGCQLGAWVDGQYSMDGISCNSNKFKVSVFKKIGEGDLVTKTARGLPFTLVGDNYKKETCKPIEFNGQSSVVCEGEKSTLVYTPYVEPRIFDQLDGNLMLGRVLLNIGGKIWNFVQGKGKYSVDENHLLSDSILDEWRSTMSNIDKLLIDVENKEDVEWAKAQMVEIREQVERIEQNGMKANPETIEDISEQLQALQEDISEQILYANVDNMFGNENNNENKNKDDGLFENSSSNIFYNNVFANNLQNHNMPGSRYFTQSNGHMKTN